MDHERSMHILIKAVAIVKKAYGDDFTLLIIGKLGPKSYREYVEELVRGLGLVDNVKMLGYVEYRRLPMVYSSANLTIVPSYSEGGPLTTPESLPVGRLWLRLMLGTRSTWRWQVSMIYW